MDIPRIRSEVSQATTRFALVEAHPTNDGGVFVKAGLQTSRRQHVHRCYLLPWLSQQNAERIRHKACPAFRQSASLRRGQYMLSPPEHVEPRPPRPDFRSGAGGKMAEQIRHLVPKRPMARRGVITRCHSILGYFQ